MKQLTNKLLVFVLLCSPLFAQSPVTPVEDAKGRIAKEKYEAKVNYAKDLLEQKENLEKELAEVNAKLADLDSGKPVKIPNKSISAGTLVWTSAAVCGSCYSFTGTTGQ